MKNELIYNERLSSNKTLFLFIALTLVFLALSLWRINLRGLDALAVVCLVIGGFFLFYSINYRTLVIQLTSESLRLKFGIFTWTVPLDNIEDCQLDELPTVMKYGGAGIQFMLIRGRYRASFNFLKFPRVVVAFKKKVGLARDISFSTREPEEVIRLIRNAVEVHRR